jgi:hypothetical protein
MRLVLPQTPVLFPNFERKEKAMPSLSKPFLVIVVGQALLVSVGQAVPTIDFIDRTVEAQIPGALDSDSFLDPGDYVKTVSAGTTGMRPSASATIDSAAQPLSFSGMGSGQISGEGHPDTFGNVTYLTSLTLDQPHTYVLSGLVRAMADGGFATASFSLDDSFNNLFDFVADSDLSPGPMAFAESGVLPAGSYQFLALSVTDDQGEPSFYDATAGFEFSLVLLPVPEPSSLALMLFGALAGTRVWYMRNHFVA